MVTALLSVTAAKEGNGNRKTSQVSWSNAREAAERVRTRELPPVRSSSNTCELGGPVLKRRDEKKLFASVRRRRIQRGARSSASSIVIVRFTLASALQLLALDCSSNCKHLFNIQSLLLSLQDSLASHPFDLLLVLACLVQHSV